MYGVVRTRTLGTKMARFSLLQAACLAGLLLQLALHAPCAEGHAVMIDPQSRQWDDFLVHYNYNPHAVNAGGKALVSKEFTLKWPARNTNGICGDAVGENKWDKPGKVMKSYNEGQEISVDVVFAQNHLGRVTIRLCPLAAKKEEDCIQLNRADGKGRNFDLPMTKDWFGVTSGFVPPLYNDGSFTLYQLKPIGKAEGCAAWACDQFKGMYVYKTKWQLPKGYKCDHCKLQMRYLTGSSCWPPCEGKCPPKPVGYAYCDAPDASYPEEFWNCADVRVHSARRKMLQSPAINL